jgi:hypothetical protein
VGRNAALAFVIGGVLTDYNDARADTQREVDAAGTIYGFAPGIPESTQSTWKRDSKNYASLVINQDWPLIQNSSLGSWWFTLSRSPPATAFVGGHAGGSAGLCGMLALLDPTSTARWAAAGASSCRSVGCLRRCGVTRAARCALSQ